MLLVHTVFHIAVGPSGFFNRKKMITPKKHLFRTADIKYLKILSLV